MSRWISIALVVATALSAGAASAQSVWVPPDVFDVGVPGAQFSQIVLQMSSSVELSEVSAAEVIGGGSPARDAGAAQLTVSGAMVAALTDPSSDFAFDRTLVRSTDHVFRAWVRNARGNLSDVQIDYSIVSPREVPSRLEHAVDSTSFLPVRVEVLGPWKVSRMGAWQLIQAGAHFELDLDEVRRAGPHEGTLVVVVNSL